VCDEGGQRCAAHARSELVTAQARAGTAVATWRVAQAHTQEPGLSRQQRSDAAVSEHVARAQVHEALRAVQQAKDAYEATPAGQRELAAALGAAITETETAQLQARLQAAKQRRARAMATWMATWQHQAQVYARVTTSKRTRQGTLAQERAELVERRAATHGTSPPPRHPKAHATWIRVERAGRIWARLHDLVGADADLTFAVPRVQTVATREDSADEEVVAAHWAAMPAPLVSTIEARSWRALGNNTTLRLRLTELRTTSSNQGTTRIDHTGEVATGAQPGDTWRTVNLHCRVELTYPGGVATLDNQGGVFAHRGRDQIWRLLDRATAGGRFPESVEVCA